MKTLSTLFGALIFSTSVWAADVEVNAPYIRAVPPGQSNSAAFMQLSNHGTDIALTGARTDAAQVVELHTHTQDEGVMRMRRIDQIEVPAHHSVTLQPGGLHIMLIGLERPLMEGETVGMTLEYSDGSEQTISLPIRKPGAPTGSEEMKHDHDHGHDHEHSN